MLFMMTKEDLIQELIRRGYLETPEIIDAFRVIDRADFVLEKYKNEAYENYPLPIGEGQTISQPLTVAFMLELLGPKPGEKILDIGAGSGWQSSLLAYIVEKPQIPNPPDGKAIEDPRQGRDKSQTNLKFQISNFKHGLVVAVERISGLCDFAQKNIEKYKFISNGIVKLYCGDATAKQFREAPFDKIIAAAAASRDIPEEWKNQLKPGGKIVAPINGSIWLFDKSITGEWDEKEFPGFSFVPLVKSNQ